jgi:putative addiction module component (TIGR02574 family)
MNIATTLQEVESWSVEDRLEFVQLVWERIVESGWKPTLTESETLELDRRLAALDENPNNVVTWEEIVQHVRRDQ